MTLSEIDNSVSALDGQDALKAFVSGSISLDMASLETVQFTNSKRREGLNYEWID
jgi:hypothetical protein